MEDSAASGRLRPLLPGPTRDDPPGSKPPFKLNIPKRTSVKTACQACRQRKAKVYGSIPITSCEITDWVLIVRWAETEMLSL